MINVFYYYYYLFYTKVITDNQPHATVLFTLSFSLSLFFNALINIILIETLKTSLSPLMMGLIFICIFIRNYFMLFKGGQNKEIIKQKPCFFNNHKLTILLIIIFFITSSSFLFWGPVYLKNYKYLLSF